MASLGIILLLMTIAFILYKFFPYGGLQRDFLRIAKICAQMGFSIRVYTMDWQGPRQKGWDVRIKKPWSFSRNGRNEKFQRWIKQSLEQEPVASVVGFNKMPYLDFYYAADGCYEAKANSERGRFYKLGARYKHFYECEKAVFCLESQTKILAISKIQKALYQKYYQTPEERFFFLPPGIAKDRKAPSNAEQIKRKFRREFGLAETDRLVLLIGSGFKTKGLDRALEAVASLPTSLQMKTHFFVIGQDDPSVFKAQAKRLLIGERTRFFQGRDDIPYFLQGADLLLHPAYNENTGTVLLEALVAGLPVICTDICGYACYVEQAQAGVVLPSPFSQQHFNEVLFQAVQSSDTPVWRDNALNFAEQADIYSLPEKAAQCICEAAQ